MAKEGNQEEFSYQKTPDRPFYIKSPFYGVIYVSKAVYDMKCREDNKEEKRKMRDEEKYGTILSLDEMREEQGFDLASEDDDPAQYAHKKELCEQLNLAIAQYAPMDQLILRMIGDGCTFREIASRIGKSVCYTYKRWAKLQADLREKLEKYW